ncbi:hypothetical protein HYQ46_011691 [Verticillium longisporum]|nr:hypothetical protein HYQ46_011691 [Verticillium longisporum]
MGPNNGERFPRAGKIGGASLLLSTLVDTSSGSLLSAEPGVHEVEVRWSPQELACSSAVDRAGRRAYDRLTPRDRVGKP